MGREQQTDYLVIGAGASGLALVDTLVSAADVDVVVVDRREAPGGHWVDAYPFVRLHQPSAYYGVNSLPLGEDRRDTEGINAGFYERASAAELVRYYEQAMDLLVAGGRVTFLPCSEYVGRDGDDHVVRSLVTGEQTRILTRRRLVDAAYVESEIPATRPPAYAVDEGVRLVTPNQLARLDAPASAFVLVGAGKTAMDTGYWLLEQGVDPGAICWLRPRDGWMVNRRYTQPFEQVAGMAEMQSRTVEACVDAETGADVVAHLEAHGMMTRIDPAAPTTIYRGATISEPELDALRTIENVVRLGRVKRIASDRIHMDEGTVATAPGTVHVDCTAEGLSTAPRLPIFDGDRLTVQFTTLGVAPWSAAVLGFVESLDVDDEERNRLCPSIGRTGLVDELLGLYLRGFTGEGARQMSPEIAGWASTARLNPGRTMAQHMDDPAVQESMGRMFENLEPAMANLEARTADPVDAPAPR
ncbi:MAG: NAD(P)-binding protein [Actinomycetota bacterium]